MKSKFKIVSYFIPIFFLFTIVFFVYISLKIESAFTSINAASFVFIFLLLAILAFFFEIKDKIIVVEFVKNKQLKIKRFCGIGNTKIIEDRLIDGYHDSIVNTRNGNYNFIYLMSGDKKIAKISNQYHKNFTELSIEVKKRYKNLGFINSGFISEIKDFFKTN